MAPETKGSGWNRIPIKFSDSEEEDEISSKPDSQAFARVREDGSALSEEPTDTDMTEVDDQSEMGIEEIDADEFSVPSSSQGVAGEAGGPLVAELVATRAELKRVEAEVADLKDRLARRQADFENHRKRVERERGETYERVVAEIAAKLLPVLDNLRRALDTEASLEQGESDEFRHFLSGVDLIFKQLSGVIEALGVKPVQSVGERFDPHIHEAVVSELTDEHEPDTVMEEIIRGYRLGDKLIRPALVKVAMKK